jgi:hypothetical protein
MIGPWVRDQENFNLAFPNRLSLKHLIHSHGFDKNRSAPVRVLNCVLQSR